MRFSPSNTGKISLGKAASKQFWLQLLVKTLAYFVLFDLAFVFIYPFLHMIITSIKSPLDLLDITIKWIPRHVHLENYSNAWTALEFVKYFKNSIFVVSLSVAGHVLSCSFIAYGFARYRFPGRSVLFAFVILSLIIPVQVIIIPLYIQYSKMGWLNTFKPLIIPTFFGFGLRGGLFVFIFRQFFRGLPNELEDAAKIDGCGPLKTYWNIVLPISGAAVVVTVVLSMAWHWNDYYEPIIYLLGAPGKRLLPAVLPSMYEFLTGIDPEELGLSAAEIEEVFNEGFVMAATTLVMMPVMAVYLILQRKFMISVVRAGLTE